jgi:hypothetical protein
MIGPQRREADPDMSGSRWGFDSAVPLNLSGNTQGSRLLLWLQANRQSAIDIRQSKGVYFCRQLRPDVSEN